jgi:cell division protein FtsW (lipid II flippase)
MKNNEALSESFENELANIQNKTLLNAEYRKRKLILWVIRTIILVILYVIFWKYNWVKKSLYFTIPLSTLSLLMILVAPYLIKRKIERTKQKINEAEELVESLKTAADKD